MIQEDQFDEKLEQFRLNLDKIWEEIAKVIVGQEPVIRLLLASILCRGHCLLVGVPGLAKTLLVNTTGRLMALSFKRIQFTPDLMPSDITGTNIIEEKEDGKRDFRFMPGPIFAHIVLADEINRAPPKTQAALLEAMQERQVTVGQQSYALPNPFFVIATQNPIEQEGTYPLPEAQLDRFMFNVYVDYPSAEQEQTILAATTGGARPEVQPILTGKTVLDMQQVVDRIVVSKYVIAYVTQLVRATRPKDPSAPDFVRRLVDWGAGPRAGQYLILGGKALAAMDGRFNVSTSDIREVAIPVLRHRIGINFQAQAEGMSAVDIVAKLVETIKEPDVPKYA